MKQLLADIEAYMAENEGVENITDLSEELQARIEKDVVPEIVQYGLEDILRFLRQF